MPDAADGIVDAQAQIAFVSERDGNPEIYVMDSDGKNQRRLTNNRHDDWNPHGLPTASALSLSSDRDGFTLQHGWPTSEIYVMDADGGHPNKDSLKIPMMMDFPHGPPTVNGLLPSNRDSIILGLKST